MATKKIIWLPTLNNQGQITWKGNNTFITTTGFTPWIATSSSWWPTDTWGSYVTWNNTTDSKGNVIGWSTNTTVKDANGNIIWSYSWWYNPQALKAPAPITGTSKSDNSVVVNASGWYDNKMAGATSWGLPWRRVLNIPKATVATKENPVKEILPQKQTSWIPDYADIQWMDQVWLQDFVDFYNLKLQNWEKLSQEDQYRLLKANRKLQDIQSPEQSTDPYKPMIEDIQKTRAAQEAELKAQEQENIQAQQQSEDVRLQQELAYNDQQEKKQQDVLGYILWWQGIENSSAAVDRINEIGTNFARQNQTLRAESYARMQKYKAEQSGATRQELDKFDQQIFQLQTKHADYIVDNARKIEEYNRSNAKSLQESVQNILQIAQAQNVPDITEAEKAQAKIYAQLLIDGKGNINDAFLKQIPPRLMSEALAQAAIVKWAMPTSEYGFSNVGNGVIAVTDPKTGKVTFQQWPNQQDYDYKEINWKTYAVNKNNPNDIQEVWAVIPREQAVAQYWSTPAVRNFNPWNIMDTWFWGQKVAGERFTRFDTPQQGFNALVSKIENIQAGNSQVYNPNMTIMQYISRYAPASDNNNVSAYANQIAKKLWVSVNATIWQLDPVKLAAAHAQHEDKNSYQMLLDLWIITKDGNLWTATDTTTEWDIDQIYQILTEAWQADGVAKKNAQTLSKSGKTVDEIRSEYPNKDDQYRIRDVTDWVSKAYESFNKSNTKLNAIKSVLRDPNASGKSIEVALKSFVSAIDNTAAMAWEVAQARDAWLSDIEALQARLIKIWSGKVKDSIRKDIENTVNQFHLWIQSAYDDYLDVQKWSVRTQYWDKRANKLDMYDRVSKAKKQKNASNDAVNLVQNITQNLSTQASGGKIKDNFEKYFTP